MDNSLNLIKLCVGAEGVQDLIDWQKTPRAKGPDGLPRHVTRMWPKRDAELLEGVRELSQSQGLYACPEGGAVWRAAQKLTESGWMKPSERIVLVNTGSGLKYNHLFNTDGLPTLDHTDVNCLDGIASR